MTYPDCIDMMTRMSRLAPGPGMDHIEEIRKHFESIAVPYLDYKSKNTYYHHTLTAWCQSVIPPGQRVLDAGCGRGDILSAVNPSYGFGVDTSATMVSLARSENPQLKFVQSAIEELELDHPFDSALLINVLEYTYDPNQVLARVGALLKDHGRILITTANPLWSGVFRLSSRLGLRIPDCKRLFMTNQDLKNILLLNGFEITHETPALLLPKKIPLLSPLLNWLGARTPFVRLFCSTQLIVGRKIPQGRREYSVSIIIPCYNEAKNIRRCIEEVPRFGTKTEVIFVDDGSKDGTANEVSAEMRSDVDIKLVSYSPNRGKGAAVKAGFLAATGEILMILDADLTTPASELAAVYNAFANGHAEFVNCTRMIYPMDNHAMKIANFVGNKLFTAWVSWIIERRITDTLCGTKALFRCHFGYFKMGRDPWGDYDLIFGAAQLRLAFREVPVHYGERKAGTSKMKALAHGIQLLKLCAFGFLQIKFVRPRRAEFIGTANS